MYTCKICRMTTWLWLTPTHTIHRSEFISKSFMMYFSTFISFCFIFFLFNFKFPRMTKFLKSNAVLRKNNGNQEFADYKLHAIYAGRSNLRMRNTHIRFKATHKWFRIQGILDMKVISTFAEWTKYWKGYLPLQGKVSLPCLGFTRLKRPPVHFSNTSN